MNTDSELYLKAIQRMNELRFSGEYHEDREVLANKGFVVSELKIDSNLPLTPIRTGFTKNSEIPESAINLLGYVCLLGMYPVVYQGENDGRLIRHVVPRVGLETQISSYGSSLDFYPHVDNPDLRLRGEFDFRSPVPDTLSLLCLRQQDNVATSILKLDDILDELSEEEIKLLEEAEFTVNRPASFEKQESIDKLPLLLKGDDGLYVSRFDYHNVRASSPKYDSVLEKFKRVSLDPKKWVSLYLKPGQVVTFDNQRTLHTRNGFKPKFDGNDRWLLRVFGLFEKCHDKYFLDTSCKHHLHTKI